MFGVKTFVITGVLISHSEKKLVLSVPLYINDFSQLEGRIHSATLLQNDLLVPVRGHSLSLFGNQL